MTRMALWSTKRSVELRFPLLQSYNTTNLHAAQETLLQPLWGAIWWNDYSLNSLQLPRSYMCIMPSWAALCRNWETWRCHRKMLFLPYPDGVSPPSPSHLVSPVESYTETRYTEMEWAGNVVSCGWKTRPYCFSGREREPWTYHSLRRWWFNLKRHRNGGGSNSFKIKWKGVTVAELTVSGMYDSDKRWDEQRLEWHHRRTHLDPKKRLVRGEKAAQLAIGIQREVVCKRKKKKKKKKKLNAVFSLTCNFLPEGKKIFAIYYVALIEDLPKKKKKFLLLVILSQVKLALLTLYTPFFFFFF